MDASIWLATLAKTLVLPPAGPLLLAGLGLLLLRRRPRTGRTLAATGIVLLLALSIPIVGVFLLRFVDTSPPLDPDAAKRAQAIVILGGGTRPDAVEYGGDTLGRLTLERVRYGARVARQTGLPVLVSGGSPAGDTQPEAHLMRDALETEFDVRVRWVEPRSRNTRENAVRSAELLRGEGIARVVLVAHGFDMRRARAEFAAQGIETVAAPTVTHRLTYDTVFDFLPSMGGLEAGYYATYEILANLVRQPGRAGR
jgi:uncharacterized SAM-binding protein YcdF (DUF218 family)